MRFLKSFRAAFRGILYCMNHERHMRVHTVAALVTFLASFFFGFSRTDYAVLFLTYALVTASELFNTVSEELADLLREGFHPRIRVSKDMAAGAVLVCAIFSVAVGICLFGKPEGFVRMFVFFCDHPWMWGVAALLLLSSLIFIFAGPYGIRDFFRKRKID